MSNKNYFPPLPMDKWLEGMIDGCREKGLTESVSAFEMALKHWREVAGIAEDPMAGRINWEKIRNTNNE